MVLANIQGKNIENAGVTAADGVIVTGKEEREVLVKIADKVGRKNLINDGYIRKLTITDNYCFLEHPELDDIGRKRYLLLIWSNNSPKDNIKKTIEVMGCNFDNWKIKNEQYKKKQMIAKGILTGTVILGVVIAFAVIFK